MKVKLKHFVNDHLEESSSAGGIRGVERDRLITSLATPNFATYVENMMKNETNVLNNKLKRALSSDDNAQESTEVKHNRTTLLELFQKTKMVEETKSNIGKHKEQKTDSHLMRKILTSESASADEKLHKILQMVHLEAMAISENMRKYVKKSNVAHRNRRKMKPEDIIIFPRPANQTRSKVSYAATNWKRERWIKSDAEYLILEL
ncbi:putative protein LAZY1 [Helianthus annuus]|nr:putative protein LAZY1 [Helianthus annuus]KAJ0828645.1 putative protein LAZY1 [Helianthus annuus]